MATKRSFSAEEAAEFVLADDDEDLENNASGDSLDLSESSDDSELSHSNFDDETADYTELVAISGPCEARGRGRNPGEAELELVAVDKVFLVVLVQ